jgi:hypothetical protein
MAGIHAQLLTVGAFGPRDLVPGVRQGQVPRQPSAHMSFCRGPGDCIRGDESVRSQDHDTIQDGVDHTASNADGTPEVEHVAGWED